MLEELLVENLLIIDETSVSFHSGLNVVSGETGVGKSLLLSAIGLLFGEKITDKVQTDRPVRVEGRFRLGANDRDRLPESIAALTEDELIVRVVKKPGGSQRCYVNGSLVSRRELRAMSAELVDVHGQRDMQRLLSVREQVAVLDAWAGTTELRERFADALDRRDAARRRMETRDEEEARHRDRLDLLRFQVHELEAAELRAGEHAELTQRWRILSTSRDVTRALDEASALLDRDDDSAVTRLGRVGGSLDKLGDGDPEVAALAERAYAAQEIVADVARDVAALGAARADLDESPEEVEARLHRLNDLMRKYRCEEDELVARLEAMRSEIAELEAAASGLEGLGEEVVRLDEEVLARAVELAKKRERAGRKLAKLVQAELAELSMPHARFAVDAGVPAEGVDSSTLECSSLGPGSPRFLIRTNPGRPFEDLAEAASGGELSRVMLAVKAVFAGMDRTPLLILDEIETGVGPRLGMVLGRKLGAIADEHQVLCITHLPQVAAFADRHLRIDKTVTGRSTRTTVEEVDGASRLGELAAMLGGGDVKLARRQAKSLLAEARGEVAAKESGA